MYMKRSRMPNRIASQQKKKLPKKIYQSYTVLAKKKNQAQRISFFFFIYLKIIAHDLKVTHLL